MLADFQHRNVRSGPLVGTKVIELAGIGPAPFAGMMLAELGAEVVRIERPGGSGLFAGSESIDLLNRGKKSALLDLKRPEAITAVLDMIGQADVLIEGYRPGVAEKLGLGPDICRDRNPRLVYGRMTGWGQYGPLAQNAGHDIDYIAVTGALHAIGQADGAPQIPLNLVGDFGGGATYLVIGVLAALREAALSGLGQVVDAAIVDGTAHLLGAVHMMLAAGAWQDRRGSNMLDGGAPYYAVYETEDGRYMAVGAIEPKFYTELLAKLELDLDPSAQDDRAGWAEVRSVLAAAFRGKTQTQWSKIFETSDACVAPVVTLRDARLHPQIAARGSLVERDGILQSAPAPRFSRTETHIGEPPPLPGQHTREVLEAWGVAYEVDLVDGGATPDGVTSTTPEL